MRAAQHGPPHIADPRARLRANRPHARSAALRVLALSCCCGWPGAASIAARLLTGSPLCYPPGGGDGAAAPADFWAVCREAAAAAAASMQLSTAGGAALTLLHLAVASGSAETVGQLMAWLGAAPGPRRHGGAAGPAEGAAGRGGAGAKRRAAHGEPWVTAATPAGLTPVHLAALLPSPAVAQQLLNCSLVACAAWLALACAAGHTPAALREQLQAGGRPAHADAGALCQIARARLAAALLPRAPPAAPEGAPAGAEPPALEGGARAAGAADEARGPARGDAPAEGQQQARPTSLEIEALGQEGPEAAAAPSAGAPGSPRPGSASPRPQLSESERRQAARKLGSPARPPGGASGSGRGGAEGEALYLRAPPANTSKYEDIPSPKKAKPADDPDTEGASSSGAKDGGEGPQAKPAAAPAASKGVPAGKGGAAAPAGTCGRGPLFRIFEGLSVLLLLSLAIELAIAPRGAPGGADSSAPAAAGGAALAARGAAAAVQSAATAAAAAGGGKGPLWAATAGAVHTVPLAVLVASVMLAMLVIASAIAAYDALEARWRADDSAAAGGGARVFWRPWPAFADGWLEAAYEDVSRRRPQVQHAACRVPCGSEGQSGGLAACLRRAAVGARCTRPARRAAALADTYQLALLLVPPPMPPPPQHHARRMVQRDAAVSAALLALLFCAPAAPPAAPSVPPLGLKLLRAVGSMLPPSVAAVSMPRYQRNRSSAVLASHLLLLLGGLPWLIATWLGRQAPADHAWVCVAVASALALAQPTRLAHSAYLLLWQAVPPVLRAVGARAPLAVCAHALGQLGVVAVAGAAAYRFEMADRWAAGAARAIARMLH